MTLAEKLARAAVLDAMCKSRGVPAQIARALDVDEKTVRRLRAGKLRFVDAFRNKLPAHLRKRFDEAMRGDVQLQLPGIR